MNELLTQILQWMRQHNYCRASYDRLLGIIPAASTDAQLDELVDTYPAIFTHVTIKGGLPGLKLQEGVNLDFLDLMTGALTTTQIEKVIPALDSLASDTAPRITKQDIDRAVFHESVFNAAEAIAAVNKCEVGELPSTLRNMTICIQTLWNGFNVVGTSACVNSANYNAETGTRLAREDAERKVSQLLGFDLMERQFNGTVSS